MILRPVGTGFGVAMSQITNSLWVRIHHSGRVWLLLECITFRWDFAPSCIMFWFLLEFLWFGFNGLKMHFYTLCKKKCAELKFQSTQIIVNDHQRYRREYFFCIKIIWQLPHHFKAKTWRHCIMKIMQMPTHTFSYKKKKICWSDSCCMHID